MSVNLFSNTLQQFLNATAIGQDRIIRKEVSLGTIRETLPPQGQLGLGFAPFLNVATDDVIFNYLKGDTDGLAPARAEDAEAELAQKDDSVLGQGQASVIDWSIKDHYDASDVTRYRDFLRVYREVQTTGNLDLTIGSMLEDYATKFARDTLRRKRKLDNRINQMIMSSLAAGSLAYNDNKIKFAVDWGRPATQSAGNAANSIGGASSGAINWSGYTHDPIKFIQDVQEHAFNTYGVRLDRILTSKAVTRRIVNSEKFAQRAGLGAAIKRDGTAAAPDPRYLLDGWGPDAATQVVEAACDVQFILDDSVYRTRAVGSKNVVLNRFFPENLMVFLPSLSDVNEIDDTEIGFARTLTSPHPEGNWTPGFYEWERSTVDPWGQDAGTGIKAFPVFLHMDLTYAFNVTI